MALNALKLPDVSADVAKALPITRASASLGQLSESAPCVEFDDASPKQIPTVNSNLYG